VIKNGPGRPAIRLPGRVSQHTRDVLAGNAAPVQPRDAATVMVLRPLPGAADRGGFQVHMLRRPSSMAFAPGAYVFPGGSVDKADAGADLGWAGPGPAEWGQALGAPPALAQALVCAAVRETFEECGVLLAGPDADSVVASTAGGAWADDRRELLAGEASLAELLRQRGLVLRSDLLRPWSRWITPESEARRFDTRFFAAALPPGQEAQGVGREADEAVWVEPGEALASAARGDSYLLPPTAVTLAELARCETVAAALAAPRAIRPLVPEVTVTGDTVCLRLPDGVEYPL
jgi:8-oxo-dGTP pyrophosphatase MutT (NUDIX family)